MAPPRRAAVAVAAVIAAVALAGWLWTGPLGTDPPVRTAVVPSYWGDVPLRCRTTRAQLERGDVEVFRCRPDGVELPPAGRYTEATTSWQSDIDRRTALRHDIVISPSGLLRGWAVYSPTAA